MIQHKALRNVLNAFYLKKIILVQLFHGISLNNLNQNCLFLLYKNQAQQMKMRGNI